MGGLHGWAAAERMLESGGFESRQRVFVSEPAVEPIRDRRPPAWSHVLAGCGRLTRGGVRARWGDRGGGLRLLGGPTLLRFGPPELHHTDGVVSCRLRDRGRPAGGRAGGSVTLAQRRRGRRP